MILILERFIFLITNYTILTFNDLQTKLILNFLCKYLVF